jgi:RimJ/RimL family protein N-acetyltransferase
METERLVLRRWSEDDVDALARVFAEPAFWHYPFERGFTREETERFVARQLEHWSIHGFGMWAVEVKDGHALGGYAGLAIPSWLPEVMPAVEVGWRLHPDHWGRGLATECGRASLRYGFEDLGLDRIIAVAMAENVASLRVMEKLGMKKAGEAYDTLHDVPLEVHEITRAAWCSEGT